MQTPVIDAELSRYWTIITENQKLLVLDVLKNFVAANLEPHDSENNATAESSLSDAEWENIMRQREAIANGTAKTYSWDEVKANIIQKYGARKIQG